MLCFPLRKRGASEFNFEFTNTGTDILKINDINTSRGCAAVIASSSHLKQREKGTIRAGVATFNKKGLMVETIEALNNDPERPNVILTLQATMLENILPSLEQDIRQ
jgi:hypothetical protein